MRKYILILTIFFSFNAKSQNNSKIDWGADLEYIKVELPKKHINFYHEKSEKDFLQGIDKISSSKDKLTDFEITIKLQQLVASFGDMHTETVWTQFLDKNKFLQLNFYWFSDGIYIFYTKDEYKEALGSKVLEINNIPIKAIIDSFSTLFTIDNNAIIKNKIPQLLPYAQLYRYFGIAKSDTFNYKLENQKGEKFNDNIICSSIDKNKWVAFKPDSVALSAQNSSAFFADNILKKENVYYIQYNTCNSREYPPYGFKGDTSKLPSINDFHKKVIETIKNNNFRKLIFDLRSNSGGNSTPGTELIKDISLINQINQNGKIYVLIGRRTFSSAINNAMDFKKMTQAIFVGEETSGKPNCYGEIKFIKLPNSGLSVSYSTNYFKLYDKDLNTLTPDFIIDKSFKDYKEGRDPAFDWILKQ
jgi:C-terminal processing protease CtpA/Prc